MIPVRIKLRLTLIWSAKEASETITVCSPTNIVFDVSLDWCYLQMVPIFCRWLFHLVTDRTSILTVQGWSNIPILANDSHLDAI